MISKIINYYRNYRRQKWLSSLPISIQSGTLLQPEFNLSLHGSSKNNPVTVGSNSVLCCKLVLERPEAEIHIGNNTYIGNSSIISAQNINIGNDVLMAWGITIVDHDSHSLAWENRKSDVELWRKGLQSGYSTAALMKNWEVVPMAPVTIKDKVWIGFNVVILKGVTIGEGSVIAANSIVTKDVPPGMLYRNEIRPIIEPISEKIR